MTERWRAEMPGTCRIDDSEPLCWASDTQAIVTRANAELDAAEAEKAALTKEQDELKEQIRLADSYALSHLANAGICTPAEGFREAGWNWLGHHIDELKKQQDALDSELAARRASDPYVRAILEQSEYSGSQKARDLLAADWLKMEGGS